MLFTELTQEQQDAVTGLLSSLHTFESADGEAIRAVFGREKFSPKALREVIVNMSKRVPEEQRALFKQLGTTKVLSLKTDVVFDPANDTATAPEPGASKREGDAASPRPGKRAKGPAVSSTEDTTSSLSATMKSILQKIAAAHAERAAHVH